MRNWLVFIDQVDQILRMLEAGKKFEYYAIKLAGMKKN
jgi:hypothetical protein